MFNKKIKEKVLKLAREWQSDIEKNPSLPGGLNSKLDKLLLNPKNKVFLIELMDQSFRGFKLSRTDNQIRYIFEKYGYNKLDQKGGFFAWYEQGLIILYYYLGWLAPFISVPIFKEKVRFDASNFVVTYSDIERFIKKKQKDGVHINVNKIGESVIGHREASERMENYLHMIKSTNIGHIAVKISTIYSQVSSIGIKHCVKELVERLSILYRAAADATYEDNLGNKYKKWIHLDMEEYRDLEITYEVFVETLNREEFKDFGQAGIALQAYLPDTMIYYNKLLEWAKKRVQAGGAPVKIRLVKGANMEMEMTEASHRDWELVTYNRKIDTDSNYKSILAKALKKENAQYIKVGIASHNLFDICYAYTLAKEEGSENYIYFEMLEGMLEGLKNQLIKQGQTVLLYVPVAERKSYTSAIGYLVRRLDENTSEENFMRYGFGLKVDSPEYKMLENQFIAAFDGMESIKQEPNRKQNRLKQEVKERPSYYDYAFKNIADTDFALKANRDWAEAIINKWRYKRDERIPIVINGKEEYSNEFRKEIKLYDWSEKNPKDPICLYTQSNKNDIKRALEAAKADDDRWSEESLEDIYKIFSKAAVLCEERRGDLIGVAALELGKVFTETDVEVSEAIDFIHFYSKAAIDNKRSTVNIKPKGVVTVISPWNFPIAIPIGGIAAALAVGNRVIFKPSSDSVYSAYEAAKIFWDAGVSKKALQFVPSSGRVFGEVIGKSDIVDAVILTGSENAAYEMLQEKNDLFMTAETGGKNAMIISSMSDLDLAVSHAIQSAYSNSGQKCSAASLLLVESSIYKSEKFKNLMIDAITSIEVGNPWDFKNKISRLVRKPSGLLKEALESIEGHEEWWVAPAYAEDNPYMLKPSLKYGTKVGDFTYKYELFGPVLSIMSYDSIEEAIQIANGTGYGLTAGIHSLDDREIKLFLEKIEAGNLYINRGITGAIVLRQPFGGMKKSVIGTGRKVGHWNYLSQFIDIQDNKEHFESYMDKDFKVLNGQSLDLYGNFLDKIYDEVSFEDEKYIKDLKRLSLALKSYKKAYKEEFEGEKRYTHIRGEDNYFRYIPVESVLYRVHENDCFYEVLAILLAALVVKTKIYVSVEHLESHSFLEYLLRYQKDLNFEVLVQSESEFKSSLKEYERIRFTKKSNVSPAIWKQAVENDAQVIQVSYPVMEGRYELLHYLKEQSISHSYHRYGNLGERGLKEDDL